MNHTGTATAQEREREEYAQSQTQNGNGFLGKFSKVSPLILFGAGAIMSFGVNYATNQQHSASSEAEIKQILVQHEEALRELKSTVATVVPRAEHEAVAEKERENARLQEKLQDERYANVQRQLDELKSKSPGRN